MSRQRIARLFRMSSLALLAVAASTALLAGAFDQELGPDDTKVVGKVKMDPSRGKGADSGRGPAPYLPALKAPPKRVALASFYVWDCGNTDKNLYMGFKRTTTKNVTATGMDAFASELYDAAIATLEEGFEAHGMQLLTPSEFLDSAAKREAYESFEVKYGLAGKFAGIGRKQTADNWRLYGVPEGFKLMALPIINDAKDANFSISGDGKLFQNLGDELAHTLGVDAVVIVYSVVQNQGKSIEMLGSYLYMFGPNPVQRDDDPSLYWTGHQYAGVHLKLGVPFVKMDRKGNATDADFAGFARVARALSARTGDYLVARISGKD